MLNAMVPSTGADGTCTTPSVASASVMLCATVNAVIVFYEQAHAVHNENKREDKEQMVDAEKNVLDAEDENIRWPPAPRFLW